MLLLQVVGFSNTEISRTCWLSIDRCCQMGYEAISGSCPEPYRGQIYCISLTICISTKQEVKSIKFQLLFYTFNRGTDECHVVMCMMYLQH